MKKLIRFSILSIFIFLISLFIQAQPCEQPDNGTGTITLPPMGCDYFSPDNVWMIIDGLPAGTTIELDGPLTNYVCGTTACSLSLPQGDCEGIGGSLVGNFHCFEATLDFEFTGTGQLAGFSRTIAFPVSCEVHTGPRNQKGPFQQFACEMINLEGEIVGDPDFDNLKITAGTDNGLPSPGQTTLTQLPSGDFNVDSFFDITYEIEFTGAPGGALDGMMGISPGTIRMRTGEPALLPISLIGGEDPYTSPCGTFEFGEDGDCEIPPEFFGPGSDPFDGVVAFKGNPSEGSMFPNADVLITRTMDINIEPGITETVPIEIVQLSLKSTDPIKVTYDGGMTESFFDVFVEIDVGYPSTGTSDITQIDDFGGEFDYDITLQPVFTFVELGPGPDRVFSPGGWGYSSAGPNLWMLSPIPGEFDVVSDERIILQSSSGTSIEFLPLPIRYDNFSVQIDETGAVENSYGTGWNNSTWYYYPEYPWTNVWFYDHPFDPNRQKIITGTLELLPRDPGQNSIVEIVWNWTTPLWPGWPNNDQPPLPEDVDGDPYNEDDVIVRQNIPYFFNGIINGPIPIEVPFATLNYNPEWISVDIRGSNFVLNGDFQHICWTEGNCSEQDIDWGDAPDQPYPTFAASNGANHFIDGITYMGAMVDGEPDGQPHALAQGDDQDIFYPPPNDDEDGVTFLTPFVQNQMANIDVIASVPGFLNAWLDFAQDGSWAESGDQIFINAPLVGGNNPLNIWIPSTAVSGQTFIRFRFDTNGGLNFDGSAPDGEVEDYQVDIITEGSSLKWEQLPDLSPTGMDVDATWQPQDPDNPPMLLADDFECTETGYITDIHIWGSWMNDELPYWESPEAVEFTFSIHSDIPDPDGNGPEYSMPGDTLWMRTWIPTFADVEWIDAGVEDWYNPFYPTWLNDNHTMCFKYNYILDPADYFLQEGTLSEPIVYWLDVQAVPQDPSMPHVRFGWKTSLDHWNDDAVWIDAEEPYNGVWNELRYPLGHEYETQSVDLAFQITTEEGPTDESDFGDAPEDALAYPSSGIVGNFPTCVGVPVAGWIEHQTMDLYFGQTFDLENEGNAGLCPSFNPDQYNQDECFADGDAGLIFPDGFTIAGPIGSETVQPCVAASNQHLGYTCTNAIWGVDIDIDINNNMATSSQGYLNVFIDWNQDGQWSGFSNCPGYAVQEHVLVDFPINNPHNGPVSTLMAAGTTLPIGPNPGYVWARFTLTDVQLGSGWDAAGSYADGETEDYLLLILEEEDVFDFGDASDLPYPTLLPNGARHLIDGVTYLGASVDAEPDGQQTPFADGDDLDGNDDEDGVNFDWPATVGNPCKITVNASVDSALFSGWVDFDGNGSWADPGEHVFADRILIAGDNDLHFIVPPTTTAGLVTYARFRFSNQAGLSFTGPAFNGEVEDYEITIEDYGEYKWAQYPDTSLIGLHAHDYLLPPYQSIVVADDWLCNGGLVTDIHWWGNYELDPGGQELRGAGIDHFHISIHFDDPTGSCLPLGEIVGFDVYFPPLVEHNTGLVNIDGCSIYKYDFILPTPFQQEEGKRYWVDISAFSSDSTNPAIWRWQESMRSHYPILCGAVDRTNPTPGTWSYITWAPSPYRYSDMAFIITSVEPELMDFGDARDPGYPTLLASNGAAHVIDTTLFLGNSIDYEPDGIPHPNALGDDNTGIDDEDGVTINAVFSDLTPSGHIWYDVITSNPGTLNVWIDWDANLSWGEADNHAEINIPMVTGSNVALISIPATAVIGDTYSRFRFSSVSGLSYTGTAPDGEVEDYEITIGGDVDVNLKAFLEGPFNGTAMDTDLNSSGLIPLSQPYNSDATAPWYYTGSESVSSIPNINVVDWVMVEFRDAPTAAAATGATMVSQQAAFILNDGTIVGLDGVSPVKTNGLYLYDLYVVIWHRNHLGVMSAIPIVPSGINQYTYDFTTSPGQAYLNGQKNLSGGIYGLIGGDGQPNGTINISDLITVWTSAAGTPGYIMSDYNMDTQVDNKDKDDVWHLNNTSGTQVPN